MSDTPRAAREFARLIEIMATLRAPDGCPWDREQTIDSLKPFVLEETYESIISTLVPEKPYPTLKGIQTILRELGVKDPAARALFSRRVGFLDGNAYTSRPGPRLVDAAEILARLIHGSNR